MCARLRQCMLKGDLAWVFPGMWAGLLRHHPFQKKDALAIGSKSIVGYGEQINADIAVLTEDVVKPELCSEKAM